LPPSGTAALGKIFRPASLTPSLRRRTAALNAVAGKHRHPPDGERKGRQDQVAEPRTPGGGEQVDRIELDARTARCAEHLDREGVLEAITEARRAFRSGDLAAARTWTEVAEYAADLIIEGASA
jgi:hypothetical protein